MHIMLDSTVCLTRQGDQFLWLNNPSSTAFCIITSDADDDGIQRYGCYTEENQIYDVTNRDGKICWNNLITTMNFTKIYDIFESGFENHSTVLSVRTYNKAYTIIIESE